LTVIAFNELFEVAYFTDLIANITNNHTGYRIEGQEEVLRNLNVIVNVSSPSDSSYVTANNPKNTSINVACSKSNCMPSTPMQHSRTSTRQPSSLANTSSQYRTSNQRSHSPRCSQMSSWALCRTQMLPGPIPRTRLSYAASPRSSAKKENKTDGTGS
jgi:hypothetical protein